MAGLFLKLHYHASYHGIPEREQTESCGALCHWEDAEHSCWLCDGGRLRAAHPALAAGGGPGGGGSGRLVPHPQVPGALQGRLRLRFTPLPYSCVSAYI